MKIVDELKVINRWFESCKTYEQFLNLNKFLINKVNNYSNLNNEELTLLNKLLKKSFKKD